MRLEEQQSKGIGPDPIKDSMVKLKHAPMTHHHVQAHGQQSRHKDQGKNIGVEPGENRRQDEQDNQEDHGGQKGLQGQGFQQGPTPLYHTDLRIPLGRRSSTITTAV